MILQNFVYLGTGRGRITYLLPDKKYVIKIPYNSDGQYWNISEHRHRYDLDPWAREKGVYARCRLIPGTWFLIMEYLDTEYWLNPSFKKCPAWADSIDCRQIGYNRKGQLKAYDFAHD